MAQEIQVVPDRWAPQGEAVAVRGGKQLLVWNGIPGEPALVRVDYPGRNRDAGFWLSLRRTTNK